LEYVSFKYSNKESYALKNICLKVEPGKTIAIVGENGAGKSTLVKVLSKLYAVTEGSIYFDGVNYKNITTDTLQKKISVLFQDYILFNISAKENIWFGNINSEINENKCIDAAKRANIHQDIEKLPKGYNTILGKLFENSSEISIGQSQKLALARAFYKEAELLILDEPSSALDAKSEFEIFQNFKLLSKDKTTIYISHRFSTVKLADCIYVMEQGEIIESGTHNELIALKGKYQKMYQMQATSYND